MGRKQGSVLIVTMWVVALLALFAVGIGYRASLYLKGGRAQRDALKAGAAAWAGAVKAQSIDEAQGSLQDTYSFSWPGTGQKYRVGYYDDRGVFIYGVRDEARKASINGNSDLDRNRMEALLDAFGADEPAALAAYVADWTSPMSANPLAKKEKFAVIQELIPALEAYYRQKRDPDFAGKARRVYAGVQGMVTVYTDGRLSLNSCPQKALEALISASLKTSPLPSAGGEDQRNLAQRIMRFRQSGGVFEKQDAAQVTAQLEAGGTSLSSGERNILNQLFQQDAVCIDSDLVEINSFGTSGTVTRTVEMVYDRRAHSVLRQDEK